MTREEMRTHLSETDEDWNFHTENEKEDLISEQLKFDKDVENYGLLVP